MRNSPFIVLIGFLVALVFLFAGCATTQVVEPIEPPVSVPPAPQVPAPMPEAEAVPPLPVSPERADKVITFIYTSNSEGALFPYDFIKDTSTSASLMHVATYVESERAKEQSVILLDGGNVLQGQPILSYYHKVRTDAPHIVSSVMNEMRYDAAVAGKEDISVKPDIYLKALAEVTFPYIAANLVDSESGKPLLDPYVIIERDGLRIAVLGCIAPPVVPIYEGVRFEDMADSTEKWMDVIHTEEHPDMVVGLFPSMQDGASIAAHVDGFDLIFVKDDSFAAVSSVPIFSAEEKGRAVATATAVFSYDPTSKEYALASVEGKREAMEGYEPHPLLMDTYADEVEQVNKWLAEQVGTISEVINARDALFGDSTYMDLIHTIQLKQTKADISIASPLSIDTEVEAGVVTVRDLFALYPVDSTLYTIKMTGREIKAYLEYSYGNWFNQMSSLNDDLIRFEVDEAGNPLLPYCQYDSMAGINYVVDITKPAGQRITIKTTSQGVRFLFDKMYTVAINSQRIQGEGGHLAAAGIEQDAILERIISKSEETIRSSLQKAFTSVREMTLTIDNNWLVIPNLWAQRGMKNSITKLFPNP